MDNIVAIGQTLIEPPAPVCLCLRCRNERDEHTMLWGLTVPIEASMMIVCQVCGSKRRPHSDDHRNPCSNSNEPGQPGSRYKL